MRMMKGDIFVCYYRENNLTYQYLVSDIYKISVDGLPSLLRNCTMRGYQMFVRQFFVCVEMKCAFVFNMLI